MTLLLIALGVLAGGGLIALLFSAAPERSSTIGMTGAAAGCTIGLAGSLSALLSSREVALVFGHEVLFGGRLVTGIDPLSAFFLVPIFAIGLATAIYGRAYLLAYRGRTLGTAWFSFNLLLLSMSAVVLARDVLTFLVAWEAMSLCAYSLVTFHHEQEQARRAGWIYLVASHVAMALLAAMFLLLARTSASLEFATLGARATDSRTTAVIFLLALAGFGIKAGLVPVHVWLPEAHAAAPSHVSALMSGVLIKMGVYGLLRTIQLLPLQPWWGTLMMIAGIVTGLVGISLAIIQRDLKRTLAYSSVENIGVIFLGLGLGLFGLSRGHLSLACVGFAGGLFHVWNHALIKGLLFLAAGSVLHGAGTKDLEHLGGVLKRMSATGTLMIAGSIAISALPPFSGFASEWLIYLALATEGTRAGVSVAFLLSVGLLALIGCLTCFCFVRLTGMALLGEPRSKAAAEAHESPVSMLLPMTALLAISLVFAVAPAVALVPISRVVEATALVTRPRGTLDTIGILNAVLIALGTLLFLLLRAVIARRGATADSTWACGYAATTSRMQYTGRSFSELLARLMPRSPGLPKEQPSLSLTDARGEGTGAPLFATATSFSSDARDPLMRSVYEPFFSKWAARFSRMRWLQQGVLHIYVAYIVLVVIAALAWMTFRSRSAS